MSKWTHVWQGKGESGVVTFVAYASPVPPLEIASIVPCWFNDDDKLTAPFGMLRYVGSGRGDWWERTVNDADRLVSKR